MIKCIFATDSQFERFMLIIGCIIYILGVVIIVVSASTFRHHHALVYITADEGIIPVLVEPHSSTEALAIIYPTFLVGICIYATVALWWLKKLKSNKYQTFNLLQINLLTCVLFMSPPCYYQLTNRIMSKVTTYLLPILVAFSLHWTNIILNVVIFIGTNWYQRHYISPHCLIQFTKIGIFVILAGVVCAILQAPIFDDDCMGEFEFGWIDCDNCNYTCDQYDFCRDDWEWYTTGICRYCATYHDDYCNTHDFAIGWIVFFVIYCVVMILMVRCCCISFAQTIGAAYHEHEHRSIDDIVFVDLSEAANHVMCNELVLPNKKDENQGDATTLPLRFRSLVNKINMGKGQIIEYLFEHNIDLGTLMAVINALISIVGTSITLIGKTAGGNGTCILHEKELKPDCAISVVTIAIGVFILLVIAFRYVIPKRKCFAKQEKKKGLCFKIMWSLVDEHLRGTIGVKFLYFILKPLLVALTKSSGNTSSLVETFRVLYLILMFCSATALAYITFDKKYKLLLQLGAIMHNPARFSKTYIVTYLLSIIASYSLLVIVCMFAASEKMSYSCWYLIIYPQCLWLLIVKLYHNELLQLIQMVKINNNTLENGVNDKSGMREDLLTHNLLTDVHDKKRQSICNVGAEMVQQVTRLFLYQLGAWLAAIWPCVFYFYCIVKDFNINIVQSTDSSAYDHEFDGFGWKFMWYWQFIISFCVVIVMPFAMVSSLYKKAKLQQEISSVYSILDARTN